MSKLLKPTPAQVERLRLILSTYQDGTGMLQTPTGSTLPGWRDFERSVALAFGGEAQESKAIFDVLLPTQSPKTKIGVSCKMRRELSRIERSGRAAMELSNSAGKFWDYLKTKGLDQRNYKRNPSKVGSALIELVESWHAVVSLDRGGNVNLAKSFYFLLSWNGRGFYQLHQFPISLPNPEALVWSFPTPEARRISGKDKTGTLFEWYGESGGQLKYYPLVSQATWSSSTFQLEPLNNIEHGILAKVASYFPEQWSKVR